MDPDATSVTLTQGAERLWCKIVSGGGTFQIMDAAPLPTSPNPGAVGEFQFQEARHQPHRRHQQHAGRVVRAAGHRRESAGATCPHSRRSTAWKLAISNDPPTVVDGIAFSTNSQPVDVDLRDFATDDWNNPSQLSFAVTNAQGGTVSLLPDGHTAHFTLTSGSPSFGFTATDLSGLTSGIGTITLGVSPTTTVWTNTASGNWSAAPNWLSNTPPASSPGSVVKFFNGQNLAAMTVTATNDFAGTRVLNSLTLGGISSAAVTVRLTNGSLRFVNNGMTAPTLTLDAYSSSFNYHVYHPLILDGDLTIDGAHTGAFRFLGDITGSGGLRRVGTYATLVLGGNNTYAGPTILTGGTTQIGNGGATGSFGLGDVESSAAITINRTNAYTMSNNIGGSGSLTQSGTGTTTLAGDNSFTGSVTVSGGTLKLVRSNSLGLGPKNFFMQGVNRVLQLSGGITLADDITLYVSSNSGDGTGISSVDGTNEIRGPINYTTGNGALNISSASGRLTVSGDVTLTTSSRTLYLGGASTNANTISGVIGETTNGVLSVVKQGAGTWVLSATNTYTGNTTNSAGRLVLTGGLGGSVFVNGGTFRGNGTLASNLTVAAAGAMEVDLAGPTPRIGLRSTHARRPRQQHDHSGGRVERRGHRRTAVQHAVRDPQQHGRRRRERHVLGQNQQRHLRRLRLQLAHQLHRRRRQRRHADRAVPDRPDPGRADRPERRGGEPSPDQPQLAGHGDE